MNGTRAWFAFQGWNCCEVQPWCYMHVATVSHRDRSDRLANCIVENTPFHAPFSVPPSLLAITIVYKRSVGKLVKEMGIVAQGDREARAALWGSPFGALNGPLWAPYGRLQNYNRWQIERRPRTRADATCCTRVCAQERAACCASRRSPLRLTCARRRWVSCHILANARFAEAFRILCIPSDASSMQSVFMRFSALAAAGDEKLMQALRF